jgi:hypothetical protein
VLPFWRFPAQILQTCLTLAQIFRAQQMTHPQHEGCCRNVASMAIFLDILMAGVPARNVVRPVRVVAFAQERRGAIGRFSSATGEPENP